MIKRVLDKLAPLRTPAERNEAGYRRLLRWAALPLTDRRWAAPLSALALGFGIFAGVAIGPGAAGTFAGGVSPIIEIQSLIASNGGGGAEEGEEAEEFEEPLTAEAPEEVREGSAEESSFAQVGATPPASETPAGSEETTTSEPDEEESEPEGTELIGTVVHVNKAAGSYTVVESGGVMSAVHAAKLPQAGTQVKVPIETLVNGTLGEAGKRIKTGTRTRATLAGIVTSVDPTPTAPSYAVSNRGSSVLVLVHPELSGAAPVLPVLGAYASVAVEIETKPAAASSSVAFSAPASREDLPEGEPPTEEPPVEEPPAEEPPNTEPPPTEPPATAPPPPTETPAPAPAAPTCAPDPAHPPVTANPRSVLWQRQASAGGAPFTHSDFAGIVVAICPATAQLLLSADDIRESGRDLTFAVPPSLTTNKLTIGDAVLASAEIAADGSLTLNGLASDEHRKGAEDVKATQGDLVPKKKPKS